MSELKKKINDNGIEYVLVGDYYIPNLKITEEHRPIGKWGRMYRAYLEINKPMLYAELANSDKLWTLLADVNEQAELQLLVIIYQMAKNEGITEALKKENQLLWVQSMNSIRNRAEEIVKNELIFA